MIKLNAFNMTRVILTLLFILVSYKACSQKPAKYEDSKYDYVYGWDTAAYRDWETDRKSTRLNSSHSAKSRMPSSA